MTRASGSSRHEWRAVPPSTVATAASPATRNATHRSTSARSRRRIVAGTRVSYVPAAVLLVRKDALDEIGGFDASLRCGEDVDAVWRLGAAGWRGRYEPAVVVHHQPRRTWRELAAQRRAYGESAAALAARHGNAVAPVRMSPWSLGVWGLAAAGRPFSAAGVAGATALALVPKLHGVPADESLRLAGFGHLAAGELAGDGGAPGLAAARRPRCVVVAAGAVGRRRRRSCRRSSAADRPACSTTCRTGSVCGRACSAGGGWRRCCPPSPSWPRPDDIVASIRRSTRRRGSAGLTLRLTVDTRGVARPRRTRRHVVLGRSSPIRCPGRQGQRLRLRAQRPGARRRRHRGELGTRRRAADDRRRNRARARRAAVAVASRRPHASWRRGAPRWRDCAATPDRHGRRPRPHRRPRRLARRGPRQAGVVDAPVRRGAARARRLRAHGARAAGLTVIGHSIHLPARRRRRRPRRRGRALAGRARHPATHGGRTARALWVSHLGPDALRRRSAPAGRTGPSRFVSARRCGTATSRRCTSVPTSSTCTPCPPEPSPATTAPG